MVTFSRVVDNWAGHIGVDLGEAGSIILDNPGTVMKASTLYLLLLFVSVCCTSGGCKSWLPQRDQNTTTRREWMEDLKALKGTDGFSGLSDQSREIERRLGGM